MWCHLCEIEITDPEIFKIHIIKMHKRASECFEDHSDSEHCEQKEKETSEDDSEIEDDEKDCMNLKVEDDIGNFSGDSCFGNTYEIPVATSNINTKHTAKKYISRSKKTLSKKKNYTKCPKSKLNQKEMSSATEGNSKQIFTINSVPNQAKVDSSKTKNQTMFIYDNSTDQLPLPNIKGGFNFNSRNVLIWLIKFKEISRTLKFPLESRVFKKIHHLHKAIFDHYGSSASSNELTSAIFKVYEVLDNIIHKHLTSINEQL